MKSLAIIGAGAAGMFCAAALREVKNLRISILEASGAPLKKVLLSGGGRCNFTNAAIDGGDPKDFYPRGARHLRKPLRAFGCGAAREFFRSIGAESKIEADGRVFPASDDSRTVAAALEKSAAKCEMRLGFRADSLRPCGDGWEIGGERSGRRETLRADFALVATGGRWQRGLVKSVEALGGKSWGETLLTPTKIYVKPALAACKACDVHGIAHITGGGFIENIPRILPDGLSAQIERGTWPVLPVFMELVKLGGLGDRQAYNTFNMGIGMVFAVKEEEADKLNRKITWHLSQTFITPIDREDIHAINLAQERVADGIQNLASRFFMCGFMYQRFPAHMMTRNIKGMIEETELMLGQLEKKKDVSGHLHSLKSRKSDCEMLQAAGISEMMDSEIPNFEKVRELILWSQVYERIERAVDMVSDLGDTLEEVVLKYV